MFKKENEQKEQYDVIGEVRGEQNLRRTIGNERLRKSCDRGPSEQSESVQARPPPPHARLTTMQLGLNILLGQENTSRSPWRS